MVSEETLRTLNGEVTNIFVTSEIDFNDFITFDNCAVAEKSYFSIKRYVQSNIVYIYIYIYLFIKTAFKIKYFG